MTTGAVESFSQLWERSRCCKWEFSCSAGRSFLAEDVVIRVLDNTNSTSVVFDFKNSAMTEAPCDYRNHATRSGEAIQRQYDMKILLNLPHLGRKAVEAQI